MMSTIRIPRNELEQLIGRVTIAWNDIHFAVFQIFTKVTGLETDIADAVFFAQGSDTYQRRMTLAAAKKSLPNNIFNELKGSFKEIDNASAQRNLAVHTMWATHSPSGDITPSPFVSYPKKLNLSEFDIQFQELEKNLKNIFRMLLRIQEKIEVAEN